ncbi:MAG: XdhC family protein [Blautia sp.]|nr:XdhC family protein [Blautia sp.]
MMGKRALFSILKEKPQIRRALLTGIDGAVLGKKVLVEGGEILWKTPDRIAEAGVEMPQGPAETKVLQKTGPDEDRIWRMCAAKAFEDSYIGIMDSEAGRVYCEVLGSRPKLVICGAGHVSIALIQMAKHMDFHITVIEDRPLFADNARIVKADRVLCDSFENGLGQIESDEDTYFVVVTRGHRYDTDCLRAISKKPYAYVGMMGSHRRTKMVKEQLMEEGYPGEFIEDIHAPIGIAIQAETPAEIAVSILGEVIRKKNNAGKSCVYAPDILDEICHREAGSDHSRMVLATIVSKKGSGPRGVGTHMLVKENGAVVGTIGGGCMENEVLGKCRRMMKGHCEENLCLKVNMTMEAAQEAGMVCGGVADVYLEIL